MRSLIRRTPECALHVHVGAPEPGRRDPDAQRAAPAPAAAAGLERQQPVLVRRGLRPGERAVLDRARRIRAAECPASFTIGTNMLRRCRPRGRLGSSTTTRSSGGTCARIRGSAPSRCARWTCSPRSRTPRRWRRWCRRWRRRRSSREPAAALPAEAIAESSFRASRDGVDATILHDGALRPLRDVARATVESVAGHARELGSEDALAGIERILREGGGAARQRAAAARGGMEELLAQLVRDTEARGMADLILGPDAALPRRDQRHRLGRDRRVPARSRCSVAASARSASRDITTRSCRSRGSSRVRPIPTR